MSATNPAAHSPYQRSLAASIIALIAASACSKSAPEPGGSRLGQPSEPAPVTTPAAASAAPAPSILRGPRPAIAMDQMQASCDAHLTKFVAANKSVNTACSPTELVLFQKDTTGACMNCMFQHGCLNDTQGDTNTECEDLAASAAATGSTPAQCVDTLRCLVGAQADGTIASSTVHGLTLDAYCGKQPVAPNCTGTPGPLGECAAKEKAGYPATFTAANVVQNFARRTYASGMANAIANCALSNKCRSCLE